MWRPSWRRRSAGRSSTRAARTMRRRAPRSSRCWRRTSAKGSFCRRRLRVSRLHCSAASGRGLSRGGAAVRSSSRGRPGEGGMGKVYLAQDERLGRRVALKLLPASFIRDRARVRRFEQEARAASALNHPNIPTVYDTGDDREGARFIATEYVEGETLREHARARRLSLQEVLDIGVQLSAPLSAAHAAGIVYRDVQPANVM